MRDSNFYLLYYQPRLVILTILVLFSKDGNFIQALEAAKEEFDNFYLLIKNPYQYFLEAQIIKELQEIAYKRNKDDK